MIRIEKLPPEARDKVSHMYGVARRHWHPGKTVCEVPEHPPIPLAPTDREVDASLMAEPKVHRFQEQVACDRVGGRAINVIAYTGPEWPDPVIVVTCEGKAA